MKKIGLITKKLLREFFVTGRNYSYKFALYDLCWWILFYLRPPFSFQISSVVLRKKTEWLDCYFAEKYSSVLNSFQDAAEKEITSGDDPLNIWVFWGQGEENMPPLIKACYKQLTKYNDNVILVTNQNVEKYIHLSTVIYEKVQNGIITWAHFSDIVRNTLLARYGGLWLDATVWVPGKLPLDKLKDYSIYSANGEMTFNSRSMCFWTSLDWNWSTWCLWANQKNTLLFSLVSAMLKEIAETETAFPDYVVQDYFIYYACCKFPSVAVDMARCREIPCQRKNELAAIMNKTYDEKIYRDLCKDEMVFKLSFRSSWKLETDEGKQTFYGKVLSGPFAIPE